MLINKLFLLTDSENYLGYVIAYQAQTFENLNLRVIPRIVCNTISPYQVSIDLIPWRHSQWRLTARVTEMV